MSATTTFRPVALSFEPHLEDRVWGGRRLAAYGRSLPPGRTIGETWEVSAIPGRSSVVSDGPYQGSTLADLLAEDREAIVGERGRAVGDETPEPSFPLLVKLLDSATPLSVQLHPNDAEAFALEGVGEGKLGKTEAWMILEADPGAEVIHGLAEGVDPAEFYRRMEALEGAALRPEEERSWFRWVPVSAGDVVFVPAGTIHALGAGVVLAEIQQSSDITYRIYDWGRRDAAGASRELHIGKARGIAPAPATPCPWGSLEAQVSDAVPHELLECDKFHFDLLSLDRGAVELSTGVGSDAGFHLLFVWGGEVAYEAEGERRELARADFLLVPATRGGYRLTGLGPDARVVRVGAGPRR